MYIVSGSHLSARRLAQANGLKLMEWVFVYDVDVVSHLSGITLWLGADYQRRPDLELIRFVAEKRGMKVSVKGIP